MREEGKEIGGNFLVGQPRRRIPLPHLHRFSAVYKIMPREPWVSLQELGLMPTSSLLRYPNTSLMSI